MLCNSFLAKFEFRFELLIQDENCIIIIIIVTSKKKINLNIDLKVKFTSRQFSQNQHVCEKC